VTEKSDTRRFNVQTTKDTGLRKKKQAPGDQHPIQFDMLFELSPLPIALTHGETGEIIDVNDAFCRITQYQKKELIGNLTFDLGFYSKKDREKFLKQLSKSGEVRELELDIKLKDGSIGNAEVYAKLFDVENKPYILSAFYNKTPEKRLERQFIEAQKMEAVGNLAGGIAHDFNNLLMGIEGNVSLMLLSLDASHPFRRQLEKISDYVESCNQLTKQLLGYARQEKHEVVALNLNQLIEDTAESFKRARKQITVNMALDPAIMPVEADAVQMRQLLYNLYINAADAMPSGGVLSIKTAIVGRADFVGKAYKPPKKRYVSIVIADTGIGMDENTLAHLFEPFFTTKKIGQGTGLGLASVYGIVKSHAGYIDVEAAPGQGAAFQIYFPASAKKPRSPQRKFKAPVVGSGNLLLVDDEKEILDISSQLLEKIGYTVFTATSGAQALEILNLDGVEIDLVILDLVMPEMDGGVAFQRIRSINPDVKVLLWSGYHSDERVARLLDQGCVGFIQKPINISLLSKKIAEILKA